MVIELVYQHLSGDRLSSTRTAGVPSEVRNAKGGGLPLHQPAKYFKNNENIFYRLTQINVNYFVCD